MHNVYEVILQLLYGETILNPIGKFRNPIDGQTPIVTPSVAHGVGGPVSTIIRYNPYLA